MINLERLAGRIILLSGWRRSLAAWLAGALAVLGQPPADFFAACLISFPVLVLLLDGTAAPAGAGVLRRMAPGFAVGWWFGFGYFMAGLWWIGNALLVDSAAFAWALPLVILALPAALAMYFGLAAALARLVWRHDLGRLFALAAAFGLTEWLRGVLFTGFPWNAVGQAAMPSPVMMQSAALVGLNGMNALAVFVFSSPVLLLSKGRIRLGLLLALALSVAHGVFGQVRLGRTLPTAKSMALRIVQPSTSLDPIVNAAARERIFQDHLDLTARKPETGQTAPALVIWPETAIPYLFEERPQALAQIADVLGENQILLTGAVRTEGQSPQRYSNSVLMIGGNGEILDAADKVHLVPFGEYLPFGELLGRFGLDEVVQTPGGFSAASKRTILKGPDGVRLLPLICYEAIFPGEVAADAAKADILVNVTNDTWFGNTPGPWQHLRQAQLRTVETGLPMVRAGNSGLSAVIDPRGVITDGLALNAIGVLDADLPVVRADFLRSRHQGMISALLIAGLAALALMLHAAAVRRFD